MCVGTAPVNTVNRHSSGTRRRRSHPPPLHIFAQSSLRASQAQARRSDEPGIATPGGEGWAVAGDCRAGVDHVTVAS